MVYGSRGSSNRTLRPAPRSLEQCQAEGRLGDLVGAHPAMVRVYESILLWAPTPANVLISGETGCGKELVAHAIHHFSPRWNKPFIVLDCSTLSRELLESELFGHEKGAFTGATALHLGRFERANGGTLFLDEISNMSLEVQSKLLRVLQSRSFERIGGSREIRIDTRVVAASNRSLRQCVDDGTFREDLFHRLNTGVIELPPLRERGSDIQLLSESFLASFTSQYLKEIQGFAPETLELLLKYHWPGNVRELRNVIERTVIMTAGPQIQPSVLPSTISQASTLTASGMQTPLTPPIRTRLASVERILHTGSIPQHNAAPYAAPTPYTLPPAAQPQEPTDPRPTYTYNTIPRPARMYDADLLPHDEPAAPSPLPQLTHPTPTHYGYAPGIPRPAEHHPAATETAPPPQPPTPSLDLTQPGIAEAGGRLHQELAAYERQYLLRILHEHRGNIARTSHYLGLSRTALYKKLERYHINPDTLRLPN